MIFYQLGEKTWVLLAQVKCELDLTLYSANIKVVSKWPTSCRKHFQITFLIKISFVSFIQISFRSVAVDPFNKKSEWVQAIASAFTWDMSLFPESVITDAYMYLCINMSRCLNHASFHLFSRCWPEIIVLQNKIIRHAQNAHDNNQHNNTDANILRQARTDSEI